MVSVLVLREELSTPSLGITVASMSKKDLLEYNLLSTPSLGITVFTGESGEVLGEVRLSTPSLGITRKLARIPPLETFHFQLPFSGSPLRYLAHLTSMFWHFQLPLSGSRRSTTVCGSTANAILSTPSLGITTVARTDEPLGVSFQLPLSGSPTKAPFCSSTSRSAHTSFVLSTPSLGITRGMRAGFMREMR